MAWASSGRAPECPRQSEAASSRSMARTTSVGSGSPTPAACERSRLCCTSPSSSSAMRCLDREPKPVLTP
jgi:hypothetical protein